MHWLNVRFRPNTISINTKMMCGTVQVILESTFQERYNNVLRHF